MKLSGKIFLGISIPSVIAVIFISAILIDRSFNANLSIELDLYMHDLASINNSINNSMDEGMDYKEVLKYTGEYYKGKNKYLALYNKSQLVYASNDSILVNDDELFNVEYDKYNVLIKHNDNNYYAYITLKVNDDYNLLYIRDLNRIYKERNNLINLCILTVAILIVAIIFIAYIISKTLTKPLLKVKKEMNKLSSGEFNINLKEGKDEIGALAHEFNIMSKELEKRNKELIDLVNSKQLFIDNLSHEMNTPLTSISGYSRLLESAILTDEQRIRYLKYIQDETNRITEMYKKLLLISYKENTSISKDYVNLEEVIKDLKVELNTKLEEKNINLIVDNNLDTLYCDKLLVTLAVSNLVRNAIEVTEENKSIIIKTYIEDNKKYISVIDEGKGIEKEQIDKIVEPFYRIDKVRSRKNGGAGLGLSIVTRVMELHCGKLNIESEINKGSIFTLEFPN